MAKPVVGKTNPAREVVREGDSARTNARFREILERLDQRANSHMRESDCDPHGLVRLRLQGLELLKRLDGGEVVGEIENTDPYRDFKESLRTLLQGAIDRQEQPLIELLEELDSVSLEDAAPEEPSPATDAESVSDSATANGAETVSDGATEENDEETVSDGATAANDTESVSDSATERNREKFMNVFIGWSGDTGRQIAEAFHHWLSNVSPFFRPFVSSLDIPPGVDWDAELSERLGAANYGILCITADSQRSAWLNHESGRLASATEQNNPDGKARVAPVLFDMEASSSLTGPLSHYQVCKFRKSSDFLRLVSAMNRLCHDLGADGLSEEDLQDAFDNTFPQFEQQVSDILSSVAEQETPFETPKAGKHGEAAVRLDADKNGGTDSEASLSARLEQIYQAYKAEPAIQKLYAEDMELVKMVENPVSANKTKLAFQRLEQDIQKALETVTTQGTGAWMDTADDLQNLLDKLRHS